MDKNHVLLFGVIWGWLLFHTDGKLVDLTHYQNDNATMFWPTYRQFQLDITVRGWLELKDGSRVWHEYNDFRTPEHLGTHLDAPSHLSDSNTHWRVHQIPIKRFIGDVVIINITARAENDPDALVLVSDLEKWEAEHGRIKDGSIVLMYSGWGKYWGNKEAYFGTNSDDVEKFHYPGWGAEACRWLVKNRVINGVGSDTISFDAGISHSFDAHRIILNENLFGLENIMSLEKVPAAGARLYVFPMKHIGGSGSPCRIIAEFDHMDESVQAGTSGIGQESMKMVTATIVMGYFVAVSSY